MFRLRFALGEIPQLAAQYAYEGETKIEKVVAPRARRRGYLTRPEFLAICRWKSPRTQPRCEENSESYIREVTSLALASRVQRFKIEALTLLTGVSWPTASVILHFCDRGRYPILDYRALWSLGYHKPPPYEFNFWKLYCGFTTRLSDRTGYSMRVIDKALWQYSRDHQRA
jgi:hypothetical protein